MCIILAHCHWSLCNICIVTYLCYRINCNLLRQHYVLDTFTCFAPEVGFSMPCFLIHWLPNPCFRLIFSSNLWRDSGICTYMQRQQFFICPLWEQIWGGLLVMDGCLGRLKIMVMVEGWVECRGCWRAVMRT